MQNIFLSTPLFSKVPPNPGKKHMLTITQSHDLNTLFDALSLALGDPVSDPLQPLTVLVPTIAVGRWLELR